MKTLLIWWYRHMAAWHRVDAHLARLRGDYWEAIEHAALANQCIHKLNSLSNRLWS